MITALTDPSALLDVRVFRPEMAFPPLTDGMVECIRRYASEVTEPGGTSIFTRGQRDVDMFVVLEGNINIYTADERNDIESVIDLCPRQFPGELNMLNDQGTLVGGRTTVDSVLLHVTRDNLQRLMRAEGEIANLIMQAFIWRRIGLMSQTRAGVILYGHEGDAETLKLQRCLIRNGYPHRLLPEPAHESAPADTSFSAKQDSWPAVSFNDGRLLHRPTIAMLADELGITELPDASTIYDIGVVGAGPPVWPSASMLPRKVSQRLSSKASLPADRRPQVPRLRTTWAFPRGSQVKDSRTALGCNR
jgi:thioredoxin reductase (NADPH)